ncbi:MAG: GntR family transcriptional regulator [Gaiellaceae bacterium]
MRRRSNEATSPAPEGRRFLRVAVRERLARLITGGRWRPGERLPSEPTLARDLGVSRATLRDALRSLEEDGFVTREHGAGTFVTFRPRLRNNLDVNFGVTRLILAHGLEPGVASLSVSTELPDDECSQDLAIGPDEEVAVLERTRTADGEPVAFTRDFLPVATLGSVDLLERLGNESLYELLERELGIVIEHGVARFRPLVASARIAELLDQPEGALLLFLHQVDYDVEGRPVLVSHEYHVADVFEVAVVRRGPGKAAA